MIYWYYSNGNERVGPVDDAEFRRLLGRNIIRPETLVWRDGMARWQPRREVITVTVPPGSIQCAACGCLTPDAESFSLSEQTYCVSCKPLIMQRIHEGKGLPASSAEELRQAHIKHEASVKSVGLLYYLGGCALTLVGVVDVILGLSDKGKPFYVVIGVIFLILAVLEFVGGAGLRRLRPWSRVIVGIVSGIGLFGFPIGTIINAYVLYLVFSKKGAMLFTAEYHAAIAQTPHIRYRTSPVVWGLLIFIILLIVGIIVVTNFRH